MQKAFIFDMDGVMIDTENLWGTIATKKFEEIFGKELYHSVKSDLKGRGIKDQIPILNRAGINISLEQLRDKYSSIGLEIFSRANITKGLNELLRILKEWNFKIGLVTASPTTWINITLQKLENSEIFDYIISLEDTNLPGKPAPDGYIEMMKLLNSNPQNTIILEDSVPGVSAAKASGAFTICLKEHNYTNLKPENADIYVEKLTDLVKLIELL